MRKLKYMNKKNYYICLTESSLVQQLYSAWSWNSPQKQQQQHQSPRQQQQQQSNSSSIPAFVLKKLKDERNAGVLQVLGDGNCFFRAILKAAPELFHSLNHWDFRAILCSYLEANKDTMVLHDVTDAILFKGFFKRKSGPVVVLMSNV